MQEDGLLHTTCGTPNYVAPEVSQSFHTMYQINPVQYGTCQHGTHYSTKPEYLDNVFCFSFCFTQVINDKGYDGATADLWSCGVILFVLMAGYLPFDESNLMTLYKKVRKPDQRALTLCRFHLSFYYVRVTIELK